MQKAHTVINTISILGLAKGGFSLCPLSHTSECHKWLDEIIYVKWKGKRIKQCCTHPVQLVSPRWIPKRGALVSPWSNRSLKQLNYLCCTKPFYLMNVLKSKPFHFYVSVEKLHSESGKLKENPLKQGLNLLVFCIGYM